MGNSGSIKYKWRGKQVAAEVREAAAEGLEDACYALLDDSSRIVPHEEGTLSGSGDADVDKANLEGSVYYDTAYAVRQHEDTTLRHPNGRQAKYLEAPVKQRGSEYMDYIKAKIKGALS